MSISSPRAVTMITGRRRVREPGQQAVAVLAGQHHIQQDQLGQLNAHGLQKGLPLLKAARFKARLFQRIALQLADARIVLYDVDH